MKKKVIFCGGVKTFKSVFENFKWFDIFDFKSITFHLISDFLNINFQVEEYLQFIEVR